MFRIAPLFLGLFLATPPVFADNVIRISAPIKESSHDVAQLGLLNVSLPGGYAGAHFAFDFSGLTYWLKPPKGTDVPLMNWSAQTPVGLSMSKDGLLQGVPVTPGDFLIPVTVTSSGITTHRSYPVSFAVAAPAQAELLDTTLPFAYRRTDYSFDFSTLLNWIVPPQQSVNPKLTWTAATLPAGLTFSTDGLLSGAPNTAGVWNIPVSVTGAGITSTRTYELRSKAPIDSLCSVILKVSPGTPDGYYQVIINTRVTKAYCDMTTDGGGWTLVARGAPGNPGDWATTGDLNLPDDPTPQSNYSFKFADADINAAAKTSYRVVTSGYNNRRFFKPSCKFSQMGVSTGDCAVSYSSTNWTGPRGNGQSSPAYGGFSDQRAGVTNDGLFVSTSNLLAPEKGWTAGNGTTAGNVSNAASSGVTIWIK